MQTSIVPYCELTKILLGCVAREYGVTKFTVIESTARRPPPQPLAHVVRFLVIGGFTTLVLEDGGGDIPIRIPTVMSSLNDREADLNPRRNLCRVERSREHSELHGRAATREEVLNVEDAVAVIDVAAFVIGAEVAEVPNGSPIQILVALGLDRIAEAR